MGRRCVVGVGTGRTMQVGILSQGLRIAPPEAPVTGYPAHACPPISLLRAHMQLLMACRREGSLAARAAPSASILPLRTRLPTAQNAHSLTAGWLAGRAGTCSERSSRRRTHSALSRPQRGRTFGNFRKLSNGAVPIAGLRVNIACEGFGCERAAVVTASAALHAVCRARHSSAQGCTPLRCAALRCAALHCAALRCTALHCAALRCAALRCTALHCAALHYTALHCAALRCTTLRCTALRCTALHCTAPFRGCTLRTWSRSRRTTASPTAPTTQACGPLRSARMHRAAECCRATRLLGRSTHAGRPPCMRHACARVHVALRIGFGGAPQRARRAALRLVVARCGTAEGASRTAVQGCCCCARSRSVRIAFIP